MLSKQDIYLTIKSLSESQGFYGRVLETIELNPEILTDLAEIGFNDDIDLILYLEG
jgi:hypothetical protein